jgi:hypothetical protein
MFLKINCKEMQKVLPLSIYEFQMTAILKGGTLDSEHVINIWSFTCAGNHFYYLCLGKNCFCEFDNNEQSVRNRNAHGCGDPHYRYLMANKNVAVETEVEIEIDEHDQPEITLDEDFFLNKIMDPCCHLIAESGSAFSLSETGLSER